MVRKGAPPPRETFLFGAPSCLRRCEPEIAERHSLSSRKDELLEWEPTGGLSDPGLLRLSLHEPDAAFTSRSAARASSLKRLAVQCIETYSNKSAARRAVIDSRRSKGSSETSMSNWALVRGVSEPSNAMSSRSTTGDV